MDRRIVEAQTVIDDLQKKVGFMSSQIVAMSQFQGNDNVEQVVSKQQRVMDVLADCEEDARAAATVLQETVAKVEAIAECNAEMIITLTEGVQVEADAARLNVSTIAEEIRKASLVAVDTADALASSHRDQDEGVQLPITNVPVEEILTTDLNDPHTVVRPKVYVEGGADYSGLALHPVESHDVGTSQELTLSPGRSQDVGTLSPGRSQDAGTLSPGRSQDVVTSQECGIPTYTISRSFQMLSEDVRAFDDSPNASSWYTRQRKDRSRAATSRSSKSSIYDNYRELKRQSRKPKSRRNTVVSSYVTLEQSYPYPWSQQKSPSPGEHVLNKPTPVARPSGLDIICTKEAVPGSTAASRTVLFCGGERLCVEPSSVTPTEDEISEPLTERCTSGTMHVVVPGQIATSRIIQKPFQSETRVISGRTPRFSSVTSEFCAAQAPRFAGMSMSSQGGTTPVRSNLSNAAEHQSSTPVSMPPLGPLSAREISRISTYTQGHHLQDMSMFPRPQKMSMLLPHQEVSFFPPPTVSIKQIHEARATVNANPFRNSWVCPTESAVGEFISAFSSGASLSPFNNENSPTFEDTAQQAESGAFTAVQQGIMAPPPMGLPLQQSTLSLQQSTLPLQQSTPPLQQSTLPLQQSTLPLQQSLLPLQQSTPPLQQSPPPLQQSTLPLQQSPPPLQQPMLPLQQPMLPLQQSMLPLQQSMLPLQQSVGLPLQPPTIRTPLETLSEKTTESSRTAITSLEPSQTWSNGFLWNSNISPTSGLVPSTETGISSDGTGWTSSFNNNAPRFFIADTHQMAAHPATSQLEAPPVVSAKQIATQSRRQHGTSEVCVESTSSQQGTCETTEMPSASIAALLETSPVSSVTTNQLHSDSSPNSMTAKNFWPPLNASAFGKDNVNLPPLAYPGEIGSLSLSSPSGLTEQSPGLTERNITPPAEMVASPPVVPSLPMTTILPQSPPGLELLTVRGQAPASIGSLQSYEKSTPLHEPTSAVWTTVTTSLPVTAPLHAPLACVAAGTTPPTKPLDASCLTESTLEQAMSADMTSLNPDTTSSLIPNVMLR